MPDEICVGDWVQIHLDAKIWRSEGWFDGMVVRIEPYSQHRSFYWVELTADAQALLGGGVRLVSVLNPKNILRA